MRPEAVIIAVSDLEALEETLDLLSTPGAVDQIRQAEDEIARGGAPTGWSTASTKRNGPST